MKKWAVLLLLSMAMFIIVIDTTIMNVSISALVEDLDTTVSGVQAAISIYALVMASFILIGGKLADILGKKRVFVIGLCIYGVGTTIASFRLHNAVKLHALLGQHIVQIRFILCEQTQITYKYFVSKWILDEFVHSHLVKI